jgi:uncharacterized protein YkwD
VKAARVVIGMLSATLLAGCAGVVPAGAPPPGALAQAISVDNYDRALLADALFLETNRAREREGVHPLARLALLDAAADVQAVHMALMLRAEHSNPGAEDRTPGDRVHHVGLTWASVGENVLLEPALPPAGARELNYTYASLATFLVGCWMNSPPHRANILNPDFTGLGCSARFAHSVFGYQMVFASQVFVERPSEGAGPG